MVDATNLSGDEKLDFSRKTRSSGEISAGGKWLSG